MSASTLPDLKNSTIVRFNKSITYQLLQKSFRTLERYAPGLGARWAERLWFRIPASGSTAIRRPDWLPDGRRFEVSVNGRQVSGERWGSGPLVYLVHGWGGWGMQFAMFVPLLVESGYSVVTYDAPSHGRSAPGPMGRRHGSILDFIESLKAVTAMVGPAHAIIAHSLGSTAVAAALREGVQVERLVFLAPMADPRNYLHGFVRLLGGGERIRERLQTRIEQRVSIEMQAFSVPDIGRDAALPLLAPPLLIFHDRDDRETSWSDGAGIMQAWPDARLVTTHKLGHRRILSSPAVIRQAVQFVLAGHSTAQAQPKTLPPRAARPAPRAEAAQAFARRFAQLGPLVLLITLADLAASGRAQETLPSQARGPAAVGTFSSLTLSGSGADSPQVSAEETWRVQQARRREAGRELRRQLQPYGFIPMQLGP